MSRKHNARHERAPSKYPARLAARGLSSAAARMPFYDAKRREHDTFDGAVRADTRKDPQ